MFRILHITAINTLLARSGIPAVVKGLSEHQNNIKGVEARVLSLRAKSNDAGSPYFDNLDGRSFRDYLKWYNPDIVIIHDFYYLQYTLLAFYLKMMNIPFVLEPHGAFGRQATRKSWLKKIVANHTIFRILIKRSAGFIFTNEGEKNNAVYKKEKVVVIPNGVDKRAIDNLPRKSFELNDNPTFYFLGRYDINHKGLDYLFDALELLDKQNENIKVNLYGVGNEMEVEYIHNRIKKIKKLQVEDKGTIYDEEKVKALRNANILLLTSRYEGSPMTILDALSFGNPCLVTPGTNVADDIVANNLGWRTELNVESIAQTILKARDEYRLNYDRYYEKCRNYVLENYLWDKIANKSIIAYKELIS